MHAQLKLDLNGISQWESLYRDQEKDCKCFMDTKTKIANKVSLF